MTQMIKANWPGLASVHAFTTTRIGGESSGNFASFNCADHVNDSSEAVQANRQSLQHNFTLPNPPLWLNQVHGQRVIHADDYYPDIAADGIYSDKPNQVCAIMTADCLPILIRNAQGTELLALHGGWRSVLAGIIPTGIAFFTAPLAELQVWFGPGISQQYFEVGEEVRQAFIDLWADNELCFIQTKQQRWLADLRGIAELQCHRLGIKALFGKDYCTYSQPELFYSYRRDGITGRMTTLLFRTR